MESTSISLESEAGFRVLFECATIGILVINEAGAVELSNPCAERLFEYEPAELIGKPIEVLIPEDLRSKHEHHRQGYFANPKARPMGSGMELFARKRSGVVFPVEISLGHYQFEGEKLAVAFITDITAQVKSKELMAEREAWFRNMADNSPVMIWVSGIDKNCTYFNNTWLQFTGRTIEQELGTGWADGVHPDDLGRCLDIYHKAFDARQMFSMEYRLRRFDGEYRWILDVGKPPYTGNAFAGYVGSCSDIHDQRIMTDSLEQLVQRRTNELSIALNREKDLNELKSKFVAMASHEFRTPLSIVLSSTMLLEQYYKESVDERMSKHLTRIKSSVNNLNTILNDFLSLDKLEQGLVPVEPELFDIEQFLISVLDEVEPYKKCGQYVTFLHNGPQQIMLDQNKLRYILNNLLSNAMKYSPEDKEIQIITRNVTGEVTIVVKDNGIGIPYDDQKLLYGKFFRAKNTGKVPGTGLGLTIVKRYVELMHGHIYFISKPGEGTTFTIEFFN